jgi:hypothetical protein
MHAQDEISYEQAHNYDRCGDKRLLNADVRRRLAREKPGEYKCWFPKGILPKSLHLRFNPEKNEAVVPLWVRQGQLDDDTSGVPFTPESWIRGEFDWKDTELPGEHSRVWSWLTGCAPRLGVHQVICLSSS